MAQTSNSNVIRDLLNRVEELSEAISIQANNSVNAEVRNVFTGNSLPRVGQIHTQGSEPHAASLQQASPRNNRLPIRRNAFAVRHNFPGQRQPTQSRRRGNRGPAVDNRPFLRDLVLLSGPDETVVPRQGARLLLTENGHVITACPFTKGLSAALVETTIIEAFEGKIPADVDIELLMSVHTGLVKPSLAPGQLGIDGIILHRIFKSKPVYVRPSRALLNKPRERQTRPRDNVEFDDSVFNEIEQEQQPSPQPLQPLEDDVDLLVQVLDEVEEQHTSHTARTPVLVEAHEQNTRESATNMVESVDLTQVGEDAGPSTMINAASTFNEDPPLKQVVIHRTTIRTDVIDIFSNPDILNFLIDVTVIDICGQEEKGKCKGVMLDVLTHFWQEVFAAFTSGSLEKTPIIRHDLQKQHWQAIARVIVYGYRIQSYFPLKLSQLIIATCLFGEECLNREYLMESFRSYVAGEDRAVLEICLGGDFDPNDEDVIEFLSLWKCCKIPTKENVHTIIFELAHQELIQKPRYIVNCWCPILTMLQTDSTFQTLEGISKLYGSKKPTAKKIMKLLKTEISDEVQRQTIDHLKRYIRSLEGNSLVRFLHYVTGSDVLSCESIEVTFSSLSGLQRRPIVHTCGPMLEIPTTYESYTDLAEEFNNVMREEQAWSFDII